MTQIWGFNDAVSFYKILAHKLLDEMIFLCQIVGFFHHQYIWKESINSPEFLHECCHQGKEALKSTFFV